MTHWSISICHAVNTQPIAGEVSLVIGQVYAENDQGEKRYLQRATYVFVGDTIKTDSRAHLHIKFIDDARLSIRPESLLTIKAYSYYPKQPKKNEIRLYLESGVVRSISGAATKADHQKYRMNTPIAALGVLGTDYVVRANTEQTWAAVYKGAITLASFDQSCGFSGLGNCINAIKLSADMSGKYLEVKAGDLKPRIKQQLPQQLAPEQPQQNVEFVQETKEQDATIQESNKHVVTVPVAEKMIDTPKVPTRDLDETVVRDVALEKPVELDEGIIVDFPVDDDDIIVEIDTDIELEELEPEVMRPKEIEPLIVETPFFKLPVLSWLRWTWQPEHSADTLSDVRSQGLEGQNITVGNNYASLFRSPSKFLNLQPQTGTYQFNLRNSHAVFIENGQVWENASKATLNHASLKMDFAKREFNTHLEMVSETLGTPTAVLDVNGSISNKGIFIGRNLGGKVAGALTLDGQNAGMQFEKPTEQGTFQGITVWTR